MPELTYFPDEVLLQKADPVPEVSAEITTLSQQMLDVLHEAQGLGLAAPQVGRKLRLFVIDLPNDEPRTFINPEIIETSVEESLLEEGCLSIPGTFAGILRPAGVRVQARNADGKLFTVTAEGMLARVIQHELDHLNGVLFWDHLSPRKRERLQKKYRAPQSLES